MRPNLRGDGLHMDQLKCHVNESSSSRIHLTWTWPGISSERSGGGLSLNMLQGKTSAIQRIVLCAVALFASVGIAPICARAAEPIPQAATATISGRVSVASTQGVSNSLSAITVKLTGRSEERR